MSHISIIGFTETENQAWCLDFKSRTANGVFYVDGFYSKEGEDMNKKWAILLAGVLLISGCSAKQENFEKEGKTIINMPTASTTGALYPLGSSIATLWNERVDSVQVSAQASNGGIENLNLLQNQEAQVSMAVVSNVYQSLHGEGKFEGNANPKVRIIAGLYYNPNQIVVREDSPIRSLDELKDKKFATGAPGSTTEDEAKVHLLSAGIDYPDGIQAQFIGFTEAIDLMRNKQVEGAWIMSGIPTAAVTEMTTTANGRLIGLSDELIQRLQAQYPWYAKYSIPANTYKGQEEEVQTTAIKLAMFTTEDLPSDVVYELTKVFWENIEELKKSNASLQSVRLEDATKDLADVPIHEGALRYYKEKGLVS